jgi:hypothetical protein
MAIGERKTLGSFINIDSNDSSSIIDSYGFDEYMTSEEDMVQNFWNN